MRVIIAIYWPMMFWLYYDPILVIRRGFSSDISQAQFPRISPTKNDSEKVWRLCIVIKKLKPYPLSNFKLANSSSALASTMRSALLTGVSLLMTAAVIGNAYYQRQQFYPSVVYITKSNPSMAVIYVQAFVVGKFIRYTYRKAIRKKKWSD